MHLLPWQVAEAEVTWESQAALRKGLLSLKTYPEAAMLHIHLRGKLWIHRSCRRSRLYAKLLENEAKYIDSGC